MLDQGALIEGLARQMIDSAFKVHKALGPGLLESVYEHCLCHELSKRGLDIARQVAVPVVYDGEKLDAGLKLDVIVGGKIIPEIKAIERILPVHRAQLLTYMKLTGCKLGFLLNFNVPVIKDGIHRLVL